MKSSNSSFAKFIDWNLIEIWLKKKILEENKAMQKIFSKFSLEKKERSPSSKISIINDLIRPWRINSKVWFKVKLHQFRFFLQIQNTLLFCFTKAFVIVQLSRLQELFEENRIENRIEKKTFLFVFVDDRLIIESIEFIDWLLLNTHHTLVTQQHTVALVWF